MSHILAGIGAAALAAGSGVFTPTTPPVFVNAGATLSNGTASSATPALPASLVNGNILIAVAVSRSSGTNACSSSGWNAILQNITGGSGGTQTRTSLYYYIVDGAEASPTITGMAGSNIAAIFQWSGVLNPPIGNTDSGSASSGTTISDSGINTTAGFSRVIYVAGLRATLGTPSGYSEDSETGIVNGCDIAVGGVNVTTSGNPSGAISATSSASAAWAIATVELKAGA
jgi:hypothetical protein